MNNNIEVKKQAIKLIIDTIYEKLRLIRLHNSTKDISQCYGNKHNNNMYKYYQYRLKVNLYKMEMLENK